MVLTSLIQPCDHIDGGIWSEISLQLLDIYCKSTCDLYCNSFPLMLSSDQNDICPKLNTSITSDIIISRSLTSRR